MADKKTTQFSVADTLTGPEIVGIVQDGVDVRTTIGLISNYSIGLPRNTRIGGNAHNSDVSDTIAIGHNTYVKSGYGLAMGRNAYVGDDSEGSIALGPYTSARNSSRSVLIGNGTNNFAADNSIVMGWGASSNYGFGSIAIGKSATINNAIYGVALGYGTLASNGDGSTALGSYSVAKYSGLAIGYSAQNSAPFAIAIGASARGYGYVSIAIGKHAHASQNFSMAFGKYSVANSNYTIAMGWNAQAGDFGAMALGHQTRVAGSDSVALGHNVSIFNESYAIEGSTAIGGGASANYNLSTVVGYHASAGSYSAVAVGAYAVAASAYSVAVGAHARGKYASVAIGYQSTTGVGYNVAVGSHSIANAPGSMTLGGRSYGFYSTSIGVHSLVSTDFTTIVGNYSTGSRTHGSFVVGGAPNSNGYQGAVPTNNWVRLVGFTYQPSLATVTFGNITFSTVTNGISHNTDMFEVTIAGAPNVSLEAIDSGTSLTIQLATDGSGNPDPAQNTLALIESAVNGSDNFTASVTGGHDADVVSDVYGPVTFVNGRDDATSVTLTASGRNIDMNNTLNLEGSVIGYLSGKIIAYHPLIFAAGSPSYYAATFMLEPIMLYRQDDDTYGLVGNPNFVLTASTSSAASWAPPQMTISGSHSSSIIEFLVADQNDGPITWIAFMEIETTN